MTDDNHPQSQNPDGQEKKLNPPVVPCWMTQREYFAALAMQGILSSYTTLNPEPTNVAAMATRQADELIKQLEQ